MVLGVLCDVYALQLSSRIPKFCSLNSVWNSFSDEPRGFYLAHSLHANRFYILRAVPSLELTTRVCVCVVHAAGSAAVVAFRSSSHSFKSAAGVTEMWLRDLQSPPELFPTSSFFFVDFQGTPRSIAAPTFLLWPAVATLMQSLCKAPSSLQPASSLFYLPLHLFTT